MRGSQYPGWEQHRGLPQPWGTVCPREDSRGGSPGRLSPSGGSVPRVLAFGAVPSAVWRCPVRPEPLVGGTAAGWPGIAPHLNWQWAAVTTHSSLIKEPPQKWVPERVWGAKREEELGLGRLSCPPKLGTGRGCHWSPWGLPTSQPRCPVLCHRGV